MEPAIGEEEGQRRLFEDLPSAMTVYSKTA